MKKRVKLRRIAVKFKPNSHIIYWGDTPISLNYGFSIGIKLYIEEIDDRIFVKYF